MRRSDVILASLVIADLVALLAWFGIPPGSPMIAAAGLPGPRADTDRHCSAWYRQDAWIRIPSRTVMCHGLIARHRLEDRQQVSYDQLTRRVAHAHMTMAVLDSATWSYRQDSIARAIQSRGGRAILCSPPHRVLTHIKTELMWRFEGFDVRLIAYRFTDHHPRAAEWLLQVDAFAPRAPGCGLVATPA